MQVSDRGNSEIIEGLPLDGLYRDSAIIEAISTNWCTGTGADTGGSNTSTPGAKWDFFPRGETGIDKFSSSHTALSALCVDGTVNGA